METFSFNFTRLCFEICDLNNFAYGSVFKSPSAFQWMALCSIPCPDPTRAVSWSRQHLFPNTLQKQGDFLKILILIYNADGISHCFNFPAVSSNQKQAHTWTPMKTGDMPLISKLNVWSCLIWSQDHGSTMLSINPILVIQCQSEKGLRGGNSISLGAFQPGNGREGLNTPCSHNWNRTSTHLVNCNFF